MLCPTAAALASDFDHPASSDTSQQFAAGSVQRQDTPNDPEYDQAEPDNPGGPTSTNLYDERFDLFGFPSLRTPSAVYAQGPHAGSPEVSGFNAAGAWKATRGRPDVAVAILDTGIKWDKGGLRAQVRLNRDELPLPQRANGTTGGYDLNGDGAFNVDDYANDPRVNKSAGAHGIGGVIDAEDLIATFSDGTDADHNGYVDDIAGWDFFDNDNDPYDASSYFAASNHGSGRANEAVEQGNDGSGSLGVCPQCQVVPIRVWDTFVADGNNFGLGITYATDNGVKVIEGADGGLYHSAFTEAASQYAYEHGVAQVYSGDDLNTANHNYPANYNHTMLIQGTVPDTVGLGMDFSSQATDFLTSLGITLGSSVPTGTYFRGANTTQFGGHSSISMEGSTGSENTGKAAGAAALVISAALENGVTLKPDETREILEQTAEDVLPGNTAGAGTPDPAGPGWDSHFGWGRADVGAAVAVAQSGTPSSPDIPPEASIQSPDWYAPLTGSSVAITGTARARFGAGGNFHYKLEWGAGQAPSTWHAVTDTDGSGTVTSLGTIDLAQVRQELASFTVPPDPAGPTFAPGVPNPFQHEFTVRLTVTDGVTTKGIDRKVLDALDDPTLRPGFPKRLGTGGEAPLRYADLNGDNVQELVLPTEDGTVHAYEPDGSELPGWPVHTGLQTQAAGHGGSPALQALAAPHEPARGPVIADLNGDGRPEVVTAAGLHIYAWEPDGSLRPGFPVSSDTSFCRPSEQSQPLHHPKCGFLATPAVGRLEGPSPTLDIVAPSLDGHIYAFRPTGQALPRFPIRLVDPGVPSGQQMIAESINEPAIGDLNGDGKDDIVAATNEEYDPAPPSGEDIAGLLGQGFADLLGNVAGGSTRVYAINSANGSFFSGWPIKLNGGIQSTLPLIGPGHDPALVKIGGQQTVVVSATGATLAEYDVGGHLIRSAQQAAAGPASNRTDASGALNLFESASVGDLLGTGTPDLVKYHLGLADAANLLLTGQNLPYNHLIGAYDGSTGAPLPAYPRITDDFQFLSASTIAKVNPASPANQIVAGTGLGQLHAYDGATGLDAPGFPKATGGWLFAPAAISDDGRIADVTREGYLFEWSTAAPRCQPEWPSFRHDPQGSGNYDRDGTAPGAPGSPSLVALGANRFHLTFTAPGDDGQCGTATEFYTLVDGTPTDLGLGAPPPAGTVVARDVTLPAGAQTVTVRAIDDVHNSGAPADLQTANAGANDTVAPTARLRAPRYASDSSTRARFKLRWSGSDRGSGVAYYDLTARQVGVAGKGAAARTLLRATRRRSLTFHGRAGATYEFALVATDRAGNRSRRTLRRTVVPLDDSGRRFHYSPSWRGLRQRSAYGGTVHRSATRGATVTLGFSGRRVAVIGPRSRRGGRLVVLVDGRRAGRATFRGRARARRVLFTSRRLRAGRHTLVLRLIGRRRAVLDAIGVSAL